MVDILCAVLSGGNWGPTVDGFTTNKLQAAFAGDDSDASAPAANKSSSEERNQASDDNHKEKATGIGRNPFRPFFICSVVALTAFWVRRPFFWRNAN